jgi:hypothetical protein
VSSQLGTVLRRRPVAWIWFAVAVVVSLYFAVGAARGSNSWIAAAISGAVALLFYVGPRLRRRERETVQVDEVGVKRVDGRVSEEVRWEEITEIRIVTTDGGPYTEDVFKLEP